MRRLLPIATAFALAFCAYAIHSVQLPGPALACSCFILVPDPLAELAKDPDSALVLAAVGPRADAGFDAATVVTIERVFTGEIPAQVLVQGIGGQGAACQVGARAGERWVFGMYRSPDGRYGVSSCGINAALGTPSGDALLTRAIGLFGEGETPAPPPPQPAAPIDLAPWLGGWGWLVALVAVSVAVFGGVILIASRRRSP